MECWLNIQPVKNNNRVKNQIKGNEAYNLFQAYCASSGKNQSVLADKVVMPTNCGSFTTSPNPQIGVALAPTQLGTCLQYFLILFIQPAYQKNK